jgi:hypothetical protein
MSFVSILKLLMMALSGCTTDMQTDAIGLDGYSHKREQATLTEITGNTEMITMNYIYIASRLHFTKPIDPKQMRLDQC